MADSRARDTTRDLEHLTSDADCFDADPHHHRLQHAGDRSDVFAAGCIAVDGCRMFYSVSCVTLGYAARG